MIKIFAVFAAGNHLGNELSVHELAHSFNRLADEYGGGGIYNGSEPPEVNVTTSPGGEKWHHWIGYEQPGIGVIDVYEGGHTYDRGVYRPSENSKMRTPGRPFDAVSREKIVLDIYDLVDPLDDWLDNSDPVANPDSLWVSVVDPEVIQVDWYLDGQLVLENGSQSLTLADLALAAGTYEVTALSHDPTDWVRINRENLEQLTTWEVIYDPQVRGDFNADGVLTSDDVDLLTEAVLRQSQEPRFDLNGDQRVDVMDREVWVEQLVGTRFGDVNLDYGVGFDDFAILANGFGGPGGWADGNMDVEAGIGFSDFVLLSQNFGYSAEATTVTAAPESIHGGYALAVVCFLLLRRRNQPAGSSVELRPTSH